jgi:acyl-coenzyme A synthetase/AMP-(fatty) acid ligase
MSLVRTRKSPITGALVVADVVLKHEVKDRQTDGRAIQHGILSLCREMLSSHKVPANINFVPSLAVGESGKVIRRNA